MPIRFNHLAKNDAKEPKFCHCHCHVIPSSMPIKPPVGPLPAVDVERIKNYSKAALPSLLEHHYRPNRLDMLLSETHLPSGSQAQDQELEASLDDKDIVSDILGLGEIDVLRA